MSTHLFRIAQLFILIWASIINLYAQTEITIQQVIDKKQYVEAMQQLDAAMARLNPKVPTQQKQYGTYLFMKISILFRQKNYEEVTMQAGKAVDILEKHPSELTTIKIQTLLLYAGAVSEGEKLANKKVETLLLSSLDEKNISRLFNTYIAIGDEEGKADFWQNAAFYYTAAGNLPGIQQDPTRYSLVMPKLVTAMKNNNKRENEEEEEEEEVDDDDDDDDEQDKLKKKSKKPVAKPQKKKPQLKNRQKIPTSKS